MIRHIEKIFVVLSKIYYFYLRQMNIAGCLILVAFGVGMTMMILGISPTEEYITWKDSLEGQCIYQEPKISE